MRQDVISAAQLQIFAEVALFLFVGAFIVIAIRAFLMSKETVGQFERIPLEDGTISVREEQQL